MHILPGNEFISHHQSIAYVTDNYWSSLLTIEKRGALE